jgi:hypothetical protein
MIKGARRNGKLAARRRSPKSACPTTLMLAAIVSLFATFLAGCGHRDAPIESLTLYSLDGEYLAGEGEAPKGEMFQGFPVLGKTEIASASDRVEILTAVKNAIGEFHGSQITCFWPHHALRVLQNGKRTDYVICFHCSKVERDVDGASVFKPITNSPKAMLDAHLAKAGISVKD